MILLAAMGIGALIGGLAGVAVYGAKAALSESVRWSWKAAAAHALGGVVGGGLFPAVLTGLAAAGVPTAAAYIGAGGLAWGGLWSLAQDSAGWALGLEEGLGGPGKYLLATGVGMLATALLLPVASRVIGPGLRLAPHSGTVEAFVQPSARHATANLVKSEAEFLAYGAMSEGATALSNRALTGLMPDSTGLSAAAPSSSSTSVAPPLLLLEDSPTAALPSPAPLGPVGAWAERVHEGHSLAPLRDLQGGAVQQLRSAR